MIIMPTLGWCSWMIEVKVKSKSKSFILKERSKTDYLGYSQGFAGGGGGGYLGQCLLGMCHWPLRTPTPLQPILFPITDSILVTFGLICNFYDPHLVTFCLGMYLILNNEHFTFYLRWKHSGEFTNRKNEELS